jgi:hypothetical protein
MKKAALTLGLLMAVVFSAFAGNPNYFTFDETKMNEKLQEVEKVSSFMEDHPSMTYEQVPQEVKENISNTPIIKGVTEGDFDTGTFALGILAGCLLAGGTVLLIGAIGT